MIIIRCMLCREKFPWDTNDGSPEYCPKCGDYIGTEGKDDVVMPFISHAKNLGGDRVYKDMEQKSELRAQLASEQTGMSAAEVSHLKITNMNDRQREGDMAFKPVVNEVSRMMDSAPPGTLGFGSQYAIQMSAMSQQGPLPNAGSNFIHNVLKPKHGREYGVPITENPGLGVKAAPRTRR